MPPADDDGYRGAAVLVVDDRSVEVEVALMDHVEPLDGRTHWYGRIQAAPAVTALKDGGATAGVLRIDGADDLDGVGAAVRLAEYDAWGNVVVTGVGLPPYAGAPVSAETNPPSGPAAG